MNATTIATNDNRKNAILFSILSIASLFAFNQQTGNIFLIAALLMSYLVIDVFMPEVRKISALGLFLTIGLSQIYNIIYNVTNNFNGQISMSQILVAVLLAGLMFVFIFTLLQEEKTAKKADLNLVGAITLIICIASFIINFTNMPQIDNVLFNSVTILSLFSYLLNLLSFFILMLVKSLLPMLMFFILSANKKTHSFLALMVLMIIIGFMIQANYDFVNYLAFFPLLLIKVIGLLSCIVLLLIVIIALINIFKIKQENNIQEEDPNVNRVTNPFETTSIN